MPRSRTRSRSTRTLVAAVFAAVAFLAPSVGRPQALGPAAAGAAIDEEPVEWSDEQVAVLRSFFERVDVEETLMDVSAPRLQPRTLDVGAASAALDQGWEAPFRFVQRAVSYVPYAGSVRGPQGTLIAGAGNALDQSLLLAALYSARGVRTRLVHGSLRWQHAAALVGASRVDRPRRGDPWLRWVETAADHWWLEARRGSAWVELDPSFAGSVGDAFGSRREVLDSVPSSLQARVSVEVLQGPVALTAMAMPLAEVIGAPVELFLRATPPEPESLALEHAATGMAPEAPDAADPDSEPEVAEPGAERDPLAGVLPYRDGGPLTLQLRVAGRVTEIGPLSPSGLGTVALRVRARLPLGPASEVTVPWGDRQEARLAVLVSAGRVNADALVRPTLEIYGLLERLAEAEMAALAAFESRPVEEEELDSAAGRARLAPPLPAPRQPAGAGGTDLEEEELPLHPAEELHVAVVQAWLDFQRHASRAVATILLGAVDRLRQPAPLVRTGVRLVGLSWHEPTSAAEGELTVWLRDPMAIGGVEPARRRGIQSAYGLLGSAVLGHVLNSVADRPPETAFDVTLRTVGSGQRLEWWLPGSMPSQQWPAVAQAAAGLDIRRGHILIGPSSPVRRQEASLLGWWAMLPESGATSGRVATRVGVAQGRVPFIDARDYRDLESLLATVRDLHRASRWLLQAVDPESGALEALVPRACAATALVGELLLAGAPAGWQPPMFADFCVGGPSQTGAR